MGTRTAIILLAICAACFAACHKTAAKQPDAAPDAFTTLCGHPGDMGNELGIGKFCAQVSDCFGTPTATVCAILGNPDAHFCTKSCSMTGSAGQCGTMASCQCQGQCGCFPDACLH